MTPPVHATVLDAVPIHFGLQPDGHVTLGWPPTAALPLTVLALIVFLIGTVLGIKKFGVAGYLKSLCPELGLPIYLAVIVVPIVWLIEFGSLFIKHGILLFDFWPIWWAGHLVILGITGLAFGGTRSICTSDRGQPCRSWRAWNRGHQPAGTVRRLPPGLCVYLAGGHVYR
ncbi:MAG: hypothetical protein R3C56_22525 [Pirellulaceae bacterium]